MTPQAKTRHGGLDWSAPQDGKAADAYAVACTALYLMRTPRCDGGRDFQPARHATRLHVISGLLHRLSERQCNEDLTCRECHGAGDDGRHHERGTIEPCKACDGTGSSVGRRDKSLQADAQEIAQHYGLTCYFQGDPRGCSLYLIDPSMVPVSLGPLNKANADRWIDSNYTRGHAVVRLGR